MKETHRIKSCISWRLRAKDMFFLINVNLHIERGKQALLTEEKKLNCYRENYYFVKYTFKGDGKVHNYPWIQIFLDLNHQTQSTYLFWPVCSAVLLRPQLLKKCSLSIILVGERYKPAFAKWACGWQDQIA